MSTIQPETEHACLLHLEYHMMQSECWRTVIAHYALLMTNNPNITIKEIRDAYQLEYEQRLLNRYIRTGVL